MQLPFTIQVQQGIIHVNTISILRCTSDLIVLFIDTKQKYIDYSHPFEGYGLDLCGNRDHTLNVEDWDLHPTKVRLDGLDDGWKTISNRARYGAKLILYREIGLESKAVASLQWTDE